MRTRIPATKSLPSGRRAHPSSWTNTTNHVTLVRGAEVTPQAGEWVGCRGETKLMRVELCDTDPVTDCQSAICRSTPTSSATFATLASGATVIPAPISRQRVRRTYLNTSSSLDQEVNFRSPLLHGGMAIHQQATAFTEWSQPADLLLAIVAPIDSITALKIRQAPDERRFSSDPQRSLAHL